MAYDGALIMAALFARLLIWRATACHLTYTACFLRNADMRMNGCRLSSCRYTAWRVIVRQLTGI